MRVAVVSPRFPPDVGGLESYVSWVTAGYRDAPGVEPVVITTAPGWRTREESYEGIRVIRLGSWFNFSNTPVSPLWPWQLRRLLRRLRIDAVSAHAPVPGLADAALLVAGRRHVILTWHAGSMVKGEGRLDPLLRWYERRVLPRLFARADRVVAVSPVSLAYHTGRADLIAPGVDNEIFRPGPEQRAPRIAYAGRIERTSRWKGLQVLIEALASVADRVPEVVLDLVGTGDDIPALRIAATRAGVAERVIFHGGLSPAGVAEVFASSSVVVLPSLTEAESFGMVLIEAMATGTPVVGSRVGGIPHVIRDGVDGVLVPPGDAAALADALVGLLNDPERARELGRAGVEAARTRWDWRRQREATVALLGRDGDDPQAGLSGT